MSFTSQINNCSCVLCIKGRYIFQCTRKIKSNRKENNSIKCCCFLSVGDIEASAFLMFICRSCLISMLCVLSQVFCALSRSSRYSFIIHVMPLLFAGKLLQGYYYCDDFNNLIILSHIYFGVKLKCTIQLFYKKV